MVREKLVAMGLGLDVLGGHRDAILPLPTSGQPRCDEDWWQVNGS